MRSVFSWLRGGRRNNGVGQAAAVVFPVNIIKHPVTQFAHDPVIGPVPQSFFALGHADGDLEFHLGELDFQGQARFQGVGFFDHTGWCRHDFKFTGSSWEDGKIYDPKSGKTYDCILKSKENNKILEIRGYIGSPMFGRTATWTRP